MDPGQHDRTMNLGFEKKQDWERTVDGRNPKQPPDMYETLEIRWIFNTMSTGAGFFLSTLQWRVTAEDVDAKMDGLLDIFCCSFHDGQGVQFQVPVGSLQILIEI